MTNEIQPLAVSPAEAAEMLRCSRAFIYSLIERGELRRSKIGRTCRIPVEDIQAVLENGVAQ